MFGIGLMVGATGAWINEGSSVGAVITIVALVTLLIAGVGWRLASVHRYYPVITRLAWAVGINLAFLLGIVRFFFGLERTLWTRTTRVAAVPQLEMNLAREEVSKA